MNVVLGDAVEIAVKQGARTEHGRILLKGDSITLVTGATISEGEEVDGATAMQE